MHRPYCIKAVMFDFDGTLTEPGTIDFKRIRHQIGCPSNMLILEYIQGLSTSAKRRKAISTVNDYEMEAAGRTQPNAGADCLIQDLKMMGAKVGIISRNSRSAIDRGLKNFKLAKIETFDLIISRDDPVAPKPKPDGILHAANILGVAVEEILVVGDITADIEAAHNAGAISAFITNGEKGAVPEQSDFIIQSLAELALIVKMGLPLPCGKLPQDLLDNFLSESKFNDSSVLNWPGIGEDTVAVDASGEEVVVITSDPITFATDAIGEYAVLVNANDIVTSGATPRWFLTTLLFPVNTTASRIRCVMTELAAVCKRFNITLCGGHTEITDGVSRTIINGMMIGSVRKDRFLDKKDIRPGDQIILTKGVAIEGTALIAREFEEQLKGLEINEGTIQRAQAFISRISVLEEAKIAAEIDGVKALHDITEGGIATALEEFSIAGGFGIKIQLEKIPILPETKEVCAPFNLDPLGLIGSGSLLICCRPESSRPLQVELATSDIESTVIGSVIDAGPGIMATVDHEKVDWPRFDVDEITRLYKS